jgi:two-component system response regulator HydG
MEALVGHSWPGNIRELENLVQMQVWMHDGTTIEAVDLPDAMRFSPGARAAPSGTLAEVEKCHIMKVLAVHGGNKSRAAKTLGIDRKTLAEKAKKYGLGHPA